MRRRGIPQHPNTGRMKVEGCGEPPDPHILDLQNVSLNRNALIKKRGIIKQSDSSIKKSCHHQSCTGRKSKGTFPQGRKFSSLTNDGVVGKKDFCANRQFISFLL